MRQLPTRVISLCMVATLGLSLMTPMGTKNVYAKESTSGTTQAESEDQEVSYQIQFKDTEGKDVTSLTISANSEFDLSGYVKVFKNKETEVPDGKFQYQSSDEEALSVDENGKIHVNESVKESPVRVTVKWWQDGATVGTAEPDATAEIPIHVIRSLKTTKSEKTLICNANYDIKKLIEIEPATELENLEYSSSNPDVVSVDSEGNLKANKVEGTADIKISTKTDLSAVIRITVSDVPVSLKLSETEHSMKASDAFTLKVDKVVYSSGAEKDAEPGTVRFDSLNEQIATVDPVTGEVKGVTQTSYPGMTLIKVTYSPNVVIDGEKLDAIEAQCQITITKIPVEKVTITNKPAAGNWKINDTYKLETTVTPENATDNTIAYKTSDKDVATVSSTGEIKATGIGEATITAYAKENSEIKDTFVVKVYQTTFNIAELGVDGTDQKNDAADLNKILKYATLIDGMITVIIPDGTYYIGSTLKVYTETNIQLSTNAVIKRMQSAEGKTMLTNRTSEDPAKGGGYIAARDIIISGGTWDGNAVGNDHSNLLYFGHASNITIKNTTVKNDGGAHLIEFTGVQNAVVESVNLTGFVMCKTLTASQNAEKEAIQIDHCTGETNAPGMAPFDGTACDNITIRNCNISGYMAGIGTHTQGSNSSTNILIENNTFDNITNACINLRKFQNVTVRNNVATNCTTFIYASEAQGLVENNTMNMGTAYVPATTSGLRAKNGITVSNGSNFVIRNNTIENAKSNGICVWNGSTAEIKKNKIKKNLLYGIRTQGSTVTLKKNTLSSNKKGLYDTYKDATIKSSDDIRAYYINIKKKYKYKGKAVKPKITIKGLNKKYYKVTYKNNKKPGTATVTITGKKGVKKSLKIKFKITKK